jgi:hypothetical protein
VLERVFTDLVSERPQLLVETAKFEIAHLHDLIEGVCREVDHGEHCSLLAPASPFHPPIPLVPHPPPLRLRPDVAVRDLPIHGQAEGLRVRPRPAPMSSPRGPGLFRKEMCASPSAADRDP